MTKMDIIVAKNIPKMNVMARGLKKSPPVM
jgi:hypothetical protein